MAETERERACASVCVYLNVYRTRNKTRVNKDTGFISIQIDPIRSDSIKIVVEHIVHTTTTYRFVCVQINSV